MISEAPVLRYYDVTKEVTLECDSSEVGLGAVLTQDGHPIAYASRALTSTEKNYAQIEKECLAIVFGTERFEQYIVGKDNVRVLTDHKPLMAIFTKPILSSPKRLQRMRLRLQKFSLKVEYKPGPQMHISDTLSRASLPSQKVTHDTPAYTICQAVAERAFQAELANISMEDDLFVSDERLQKIRVETSKDFTLQTLMSVVLKGWPQDKVDVPSCITEYWSYRDEIATQNGLVFRGTRLIIPTSLRPELVARAHASHMGVQYTTNTAKEIMYWPSMHADLTEAVRHCQICQEVQPANTKEPLMTYPLPQSPWQVVASDCLEINGQYYCVFVDTYSDFIEVVHLDDLTTDSLIEKTKPVFATHGVPSVLVTDNGPNYASRDFANFAHDWDFRHITTSPHHSQSNGKAESAVKIVKGFLKKTQKEGDFWKALLEWRNTTTPGMTSSPAQRLMSRRLRTFLPCTGKMYQPKVQEAVPQSVAKKRQQAKRFYDTSAKRLPELVVGQPIRAKVHPKAPHSTWTTGTVTAKVVPRSYLVDVNGRSFRRNRVHLRPSDRPPETAQTSSEFVPDVESAQPVATPPSSTPASPPT